VFLVDTVERSGTEQQIRNVKACIEKRDAKEDSRPIHVLHADADMRFPHKRAVEANDVGRRTAVHDLEFTEDLFADRWFCIDEDELRFRRMSLVCDSPRSEERQ
jgi:hypothetical protein